MSWPVLVSAAQWVRQWVRQWVLHPLTSFLSPALAAAATPKNSNQLFFWFSGAARTSPAGHLTSPHTLTPSVPPFHDTSPRPPHVLLLSSTPSSLDNSFSPFKRPETPLCKLFQVYPKAFNPWQWTFWSSLQGATIHANFAALGIPSRQPSYQFTFLSFDT